MATKIPEYPPVYQLKITLDGIVSPIWRRILVYGDVKLYKLHKILQAVMGWENYHLHLFTVDGVIYAYPSPEDPGPMKTKNEKREDCGGKSGYKTFLEAISDPNHPDHDWMLEWAGGEFDPERFDLENINKLLARVRYTMDEHADYTMLAMVMERQHWQTSAWAESLVRLF